MNACPMAIEIKNALIRQQVTIWVTTPEVCNRLTNNYQWPRKIGSQFF